MGASASLIGTAREFSLFLDSPRLDRIWNINALSVSVVGVEASEGFNTFVGGAYVPSGGLELQANLVVGADEVPLGGSVFPVSLIEGDTPIPNIDRYHFSGDASFTSDLNNPVEVFSGTNVALRLSWEYLPLTTDGSSRRLAHGIDVTAGNLIARLRGRNILYNESG